MEWSNVTIEKYLELNDAINAEGHELDKRMRIITVMEGLTVEQVEAMTISQINIYLKKYNFLLKEIPTKLVTSLEIDGIKYKGTVETKKLTGGQFIDLSEFLKKEPLQNIHNVMAVLFLPKGEVYGSSDFSERADLFYRKMPISVAFPVFVFFSKVLTRLSPFISKETKKVRKKIEKLVREEVVLMDGSIL